MTTPRPLAVTRSTTCPALEGKARSRCSRPLKENHRWCRRHHKAERHHNDSYKKDSDALDKFDASSCTNLQIIGTCDARDTLIGWAMRLRTKLNLCSNVIHGRQYHHERFYEGGDSPHLHWITRLEQKKSEIEAALLAVNQRHDHLCGISFSDPDDLDEEQLTAVLGWETSPTVPTPEDLVDRFEEDHRRERTRLMEQFFAFRKVALLHGDETRAPFIDYMERLVILAIYNRSGMRTLLGAGATDVETFLGQDIVTLDELKQIYVAVHLTPPRKVLSAINDAFRSVMEPHEIVLGRRIYDKEWGGGLCLTAWDMFEDVMPCRHCALQGCDDLEEWTKIERLTRLSLRFLNWQPENVSAFSAADTLFHLSGVSAERKWERYCPPPTHSPNKYNGYVEIERPAGLYLKLPLANSDIYHRFLHAIQNLSHVFSVLPWAPAFTEDPGALIPRVHSKLCASRIRIAKSLEDLPDAIWRESEALYEKEARRLHENSRDPAVLHIIVFDRTGGDVARLKNNLAAAFLFAQQLNAVTPRAFVASQMREMLDDGAAPDFGVAEAGVLGVACGAIQVRGESFRQFRKRCILLVETLSDADLVVRWGRKKRKRKRKAALE
ncbi:hypothetical protein C8F04DRAFT_134800 [Mycena alexandri]|uniref:Uncharacterized protein n=1 Tax=Mycena alexandri TaxID=1745969 RepID=A0AAD6SHC3_9AGAR|nr:hypothetical protein C8F04DRAFT_134800 [Mycena alexandri]